MKRKSNGFVLMLVILAIPLVGAALFILSHGSHTMLYESNRSYLRACEANLAKSGAAWLEGNARKGIVQPTGERTLEIEALQVPQGQLSVTILKAEDSGMQGEINTQCQKGKMIFQRVRLYEKGSSE